MNAEEKRDASEPEDPHPTRREPKQASAESPELGLKEESTVSTPTSADRETKDESASISADREAPETVDGADRQPEAEAVPLSVEHDSPTAKPTPAAITEAASEEMPRGFFRERPPEVIEVAPQILRYRTRRDVLLFGVGAIAALTGVGFLLPQDTLERIGVHRGVSSPRREWLLNRALRIDDDVAESLYSQNRMVSTYTKSQITPLKNNYNGATPDPSYIAGWNLTLDGLASGLSISFDIRNLLTRFSSHEQITRLVCVEGWSAVAWWSGLRFDDLLHAYPPMSQAKWARVESSVNLDASGNPDPYFVSLDLPTARHPQTLLATHFNGQPLTVEHGAPLRLLVPVKLGLKNVKAITKITYTAEEPKDYWAERGYSRYDGI